MHLASRVLRSGVSSGDKPGGDVILFSLDRFRRFIVLLLYSFGLVLYVFPFVSPEMMCCAVKLCAENESVDEAYLIRTKNNSVILFLLKIVYFQKS